MDEGVSRSAEIFFGFFGAPSPIAYIATIGGFCTG